MASFLDKTGLTKFWELIKQYLNYNFTHKSTTEQLRSSFNSMNDSLNFLKFPLDFSENPLANTNPIYFSGKDKSRLNTYGLLNNLILDIFFYRLFYLFDTTKSGVSSISIKEVMDNLNIDILSSSIYLGRVYRNNNRGINRNLDVYINRESSSKDNISIIPVEDGKILFSNGLFPLQSINYLENIVEIQDPLIPGLTLKKLKNNLDDYLPYLENKSTEIKFKVEYANAIRGLLKIYKKSAGSNELELIGKDSPENTNFSTYLTPGEVVTTYLEPGDRLYMYGNLLNIKKESSSLIVRNLYKLLPSLPGTNTQPEDYSGSYIINITPCNSEGNPMDNIDLDQHYLKYGGNIKGMLGYQIYKRYLEEEYLFNGVNRGDNKFNFMGFISTCKYIREIDINPSMNELYDSNLMVVDLDSSLLIGLSSYRRAFIETSVKKGYISLMLYSEGNYSIESVRMFTNFYQTYFNCESLTELDVLMNWYDNSKIPDDILTNLTINNTYYSSSNGYYLLKELSKTIVGNVKGCRNLKKITLKYPGDRPYSNKILAILNKVKDFILNNGRLSELKLIHKTNLTDNTVDYTIDIQAI